MANQATYPVGTPGQPWQQAEKQQWLARQEIKRSYQQEVVDKLSVLAEGLELVQYGALPYDLDRYPLLAAKSQHWDTAKPTVLVTGGVHGYETSGVQGAIRFAQTSVEKYLDKYNLVIAPCVSPWGYETINRWNPNAVDPNRSFQQDSPSAEAAQLMDFVSALAPEFLCHIDLHETTDTDNSEFRPALAARDGTVQDNWNIPDGFYTVGDTENPQADFQRAIIQSVEKITHIAPPDENGKIIGAEVEQKGVINYALDSLGLCASLTKASYVSTTEVYPDSAKTNPEQCILAQVAAVEGGLDYILAQ